MSEDWLSLRTLAKVWRIVYSEQKIYFFDSKDESLFIPNEDEDYDENHIFCNSGGLAKEIMRFVSLLFKDQGEEFVISESKEGEIIADRKTITFINGGNRK